MSGRPSCSQRGGPRASGGAAPAAAPAAAKPGARGGIAVGRPPCGRARAAEAAARYLRRALEEPPGRRRGARCSMTWASRRRPTASATLRPTSARRWPLRSSPRARARLRSTSAARWLRAATSGRRSRCSAAPSRARGPGRRAREALEAELLAMAAHEFTSTELAAPTGSGGSPSSTPGRTSTRRSSRAWCSRSQGRGHPRRRRSAWPSACSRPSRLDALNSVTAGLLGNGLIYAGALGARRPSTTRRSPQPRRGSRLTVAWQSVMRSDASLRLGETRRAEAEARSGLEAFEEGAATPA